MIVVAIVISTAPTLSSVILLQLLKHAPTATALAAVTAILTSHLVAAVRGSRNVT